MRWSYTSLHWKYPYQVEGDVTEIFDRDWMDDANLHAQLPRFSYEFLMTWKGLIEERSSQRRADA